MQLREGNVNAHPSRLGNVRKPIVVGSGTSATYISPPRNPTIATQQHATCPQPRSGSHPPLSASAAEVTVAPSAAVPTTATDGGAYCYPQPMYGAMYTDYCMPVETGCEECHCHSPTCAYYRAYYAQQMAAMGVVPQPYGAMARPTVPCNAYPSAALDQAGPMPLTPMEYPVREVAVNGRAARRQGERPKREPGAALRPGFMTPKVMEVFMKEFYRRVVEVACTPQGKGSLQSLLRSLPLALDGSPEEAQEATDVLAMIVEEVCADIDSIALDEDGCHVLRAVLYACSPQQTADIVSCFDETLVLNMSTVSMYTRRVLQTIFERDVIDTTAIVEVLAKNASYLAATEQGCITLMRAYENCDKELRAMLIEPLLPTWVNVAMDPFGNYVVQCVLEKGDVTVAAQYCVSCFSGHLLAMSCDKFGSNVVEKIIQYCFGVPAVHRLLLDELVYNPAALRELVGDSFGNFVVQRIIENTTNPAELRRIADRLHPALPHSRFATKIEAKIKHQRLQVQPQGSNHHQPQRAYQRSALNRNSKNNRNGVGSTQSQEQQQSQPQDTREPCDDASRSSFSLPSFPVPVQVGYYPPQPYVGAQPPTAHASTASFASSTLNSDSNSGNTCPAVSSPLQPEMLKKRGWEPPQYMRSKATTTPASSSIASL